MNKYKWFFLLPMSAIIVGCSTIIGTETTFMPWRGNKVFKGNGGGLDVVNGVEFWIHGEPERPYKIIGLITHRRSDETLDKLLFAEFNRKQIIEFVKKEGGNGVVTVKRERFVTLDGLQQQSVLAVFRYEKP